MTPRSPHHGIDAQPSHDAMLESFVEARAAWPGVALPEHAYVAHVAARLSEETTLTSLQTCDLYLACACLRGDTAALAAFEAHCMSAVDQALTRLRCGADEVLEVKQRLRARVLVAEDGAPRLDGYSGRGSLRGWLRVIATREALAMRRSDRREVPLDEEQALHSFVTHGDSELETFKARFREGFAEAFDAAVRALPARDQTLLRQHVLDGLSIDQLGALYRVHRSTAARSLDRVRGAVLASTRATLRARFGVASTELDSILRLVRSRLDISLRGLLGRRGEKAEKKR
ncbi:MAG: hypothetical protein ABW252_17255 [Polyangiales bacterium]